MTCRLLPSLSRMGMILGLLTGLIACSPQPKNAGFALPEGSAENGRLLFTEFTCHECHSLASGEFNGDEWRLEIQNDIVVKLGGEKAYKQTYADLVTSIINPSHRIAENYADKNITYGDGESKMAYYNSYMTVQELIDLVTFLETQYSVSEKPYTPYNPYTMIAPL